MNGISDFMLKPDLCIVDFSTLNSIEKRLSLNFCFDWVSCSKTSKML